VAGILANVFQLPEKLLKGGVERCAGARSGAHKQANSLWREDGHFGKGTVAWHNPDRRRGNLAPYDNLAPEWG